MDIMADLYLFDSPGSLGLILVHGNINTQCQLSLAGIYGGLSLEQLFQGQFISPCSQSTSSDRSAGSALGGSWDCGWERCCPPQSFWHGRQGWWVTDLDDPRDVFWHDHMWRHLWGGGHQMRDGQVHPIQAGWIFCSDGGWSPQCCRWRLPSRHAMPGEGDEVAGEVHCSHSKAPWRCRLRFVAMSCKCSMARKGCGTGVVLVASGSVLLRSTSIRGDSWVGSSVLAAFESSNSLNLNSRASRPPFSPSGPTNQPPHCNRFCTCKWSGWPQAFFLGMPSVITPMCPSLGKGAWATVSFIHI